MHFEGFMIFDAVSTHCLLFGDRRGRNIVQQFQVHFYLFILEGGRW